MLCAPLLVAPLLLTTEMRPSGDLTLEPMLCASSYVQRLFAGSNVDVRSCYCLIYMSAGILAVIIQAICAFPVFRTPNVVLGQKSEEHLSSLSRLCS